MQIGVGLSCSSPSDLDVAFDGITLEPLADDATAGDRHQRLSAVPISGSLPPPAPFFAKDHRKRLKM